MRRPTTPPTAAIATTGTMTSRKVFSTSDYGTRGRGRSMAHCAKPLRHFCVPIVVAGEVQPHAYRVGDRDTAHVTSIASSQAAGIGPELERRQAFTVGVVCSFLAETARDLARVTGDADLQRAAVARSSPSKAGTRPRHR